MAAKRFNICLLSVYISCTLLASICAIKMAVADDCEGSCALWPLKTTPDEGVDYFRWYAQNICVLKFNRSYDSDPTHCARLGMAGNCATSSLVQYHLVETSKCCNAPQFSHVQSRTYTPGPSGPYNSSANIFTTCNGAGS